MTEWGRVMEQWMLLIVAASAITVGIDASKLGAGKYKLGGMADTSPITWALGVFFLWIVVLPVYLIYRPRLAAASAQAAEGPMKRCAVCDQTYPAEYDRCPVCAKTAA